MFKKQLGFVIPRVLQNEEQHVDGVEAHLKFSILHITIFFFHIGNQLG